MSTRKLMITIALLIASIVLFAEGHELQLKAKQTAVEADELLKANNFAEAGKKYEEAIATYQEAGEKEGVAKDIVDEEVSKWLNNALAAYQKGKLWEDFVRIAKELQERNPKDYKYYKYQYLVYKKNLNQPMKAIEILKSYDAIKPYLVARKNIAKLYSSMAKKDAANKIAYYNEAINWYKKALEIKKDSKTLNNLAACYVAINDNTSALDVIKEYVKTVTDKDERIDSYKNIAAIYLNHLKDEKSAIEYWEKAINVGYDYDTAILLAQTYVNNKKFEQGEKYAEMILKNKPNDYTAIYFKAISNFALAENIAKTNPSSAKVKYNTAKNYFEKIQSHSKFGADAKAKLDYIVKKVQQL